MLRRYCLLGTLTLAMASPLFAVEECRPLVVRVDHFFVVSQDSERLFQFFRDEFKLPVVWGRSGVASKHFNIREHPISARCS
jgi:hypothetical protein